MTNEKKFYRVYDFQCGRYFATGYNAQSIEQLISEFKEYINNAGECEDINHFENWGDIEEYLQDVVLEESDFQFDEICDR